MRRVIALGAILACSVIGGAQAAGMKPTSHAPHNRQFYANLPSEARYVAAHGGIRSSRYGDATPLMKRLVRALIRVQFRPAGWAAVKTALCLDRREAGQNPGAISPSDDHSVFQVNRPSHPQFNYYRMDRDPVYGVWAGWVVSSHGRDWSPWRNGSRPC